MKIVLLFNILNNFKHTAIFTKLDTLSINKLHYFNILPLGHNGAAGKGNNINPIAIATEHYTKIRQEYTQFSSESNLPACLQFISIFLDEQNRKMIDNLISEHTMNNSKVPRLANYATY